MISFIYFWFLSANQMLCSHFVSFLRRKQQQPDKSPIPSGIWGCRKDPMANIFSFSGQQALPVSHSLHILSLNSCSLLT